MLRNAVAYFALWCFCLPWECWPSVTTPVPAPTSTVCQLQPVNHLILGRVESLWLETQQSSGQLVHTSLCQLPESSLWPLPSSLQACSAGLLQILHGFSTPFIWSHLLSTSRNFSKNFGLWMVVVLIFWHCSWYIFWKKNILHHFETVKIDAEMTYLLGLQSLSQSPAGLSLIQSKSGH